MMRYAKSKSRLVLAVSSGEVEPLVSSVVRFVIPRYARKLYFLGESARVYPELERLAEEVEGFTIVRGCGAIQPDQQLPYRASR